MIDWSRVLLDMFLHCGVLNDWLEQSPAWHVPTVWCVDQLHAAESFLTNNSSLASHKYPPFLTKSKVHYHVDKKATTCPTTMRQILSAPFLLKIHFNIFTSAQPSKLSPSFKFLNQNLLHSVWQTLCPSYPPSLITYYSMILNIVSIIRVPSISEASTFPMPLDRLLIAWHSYQVS
jgi:hypothetical protein